MFEDFCGGIEYLLAGTLEIRNSEEKDQGKYECVAENSIGTEYSKPAQLYVKGECRISNRIGLK